MPLCICVCLMAFFYIGTPPEWSTHWVVTVPFSHISDVDFPDCCRCYWYRQEAARISMRLEPRCVHQLTALPFVYEFAAQMI
jgi:hypothetical protein